MRIDSEFYQNLTTPEVALVTSIWSDIEDPIQHDTPIWIGEFAEYEPVTPAILVCYLRNETICDEWPSTLVNHCRFLLESYSTDVQSLARQCYYLWERLRNRPKVNWRDEGF
jgi:hypothetical protein